MGPAGAPMKPPYGSFAGRQQSIITAVLAGGGKRRRAQYNIGVSDLTEQERFLLAAALAFEMG